MKKLLLLLPLLFTLLSRAQQVTQGVIDAYVDGRIDSKLISFSRDSLEQDIQKDAWWAGSGPLFIDSLIVPNNSTMTFTIYLKVENQATKETGGCLKYIDITNTNGVYRANMDVNIIPFYSGKSLAGTSFSVVYPAKGAPYMQAIGLLGVPIYWTTHRTNFKLYL